MAKRKRSEQHEYDDDASEPNSEELNVSSPEVLEMDDEGEVIVNSDWTRAEKKKQKENRRMQKEGTEANNDRGQDEDVEYGSTSAEESQMSGDEDEWENEMDDSPNSDEDEDEERKLSSVSFGTLAKAQSLVPDQTRKRKREGNIDEADEKLAALRIRLKELQNGKSWKQHRDQMDTNVDVTENHDSESSNDEHHDKSKGRSSKHAPMILSSKRQVTRKRSAVNIPKSNIRDPRFDPTADLDRDKIRQNYAFLDGYVDSEIRDLKAALKSQKVPQAGSKKKKVKGAPKLTEEEVDGLKRELVQKESKRAAQASRDRHADVIREHKKKERELVRSGKKAYFLKNSEVKQQVLTKQFEGMSEGRREKMMEKKRKRIASKERRLMPESRRSV